MHSHDRTLIAELGFKDPDKGEPEHDLACNYLASIPERLCALALGCKSLAKELNIPVFVLSQLSRSVDARDPPIPLLSDLRESGNIEAHADSVLFPFRPSAYDADADPEKATLFCAKARFGRPGHRAMRFLEGTQRFTDE